MVDKNLLLESAYNTRIFELGVLHGPLLDGRWRSMGYAAVIIAE